MVLVGRYVTAFYADDESSATSLFLSDVPLTQILSGQVTSFRVYRNKHGQIILDPMVSIPAHEAWLFKNTRAARLVRQGLEDAKRGHVAKAKEDYSKYVRRDK